MPRSHELPWSLRGVPSFTRAEADRRGIRWRRLAAGDLSRPFHGVRLRLADAPSLRRLAEAYAKRMPPRQVFSHETAAALWGVPLPGRSAGPIGVALTATLHVSVPRGSAKPAARGVRGHILRFERLEVRVHRGLRMVDPATAWVHLGASLSVDDLVAAADFLLTGTEPYDGRRPLCTRAELEAALIANAGCGAPSRSAAHSSMPGRDRCPGASLSSGSTSCAPACPSRGRTIASTDRTGHWSR